MANEGLKAFVRKLPDSVILENYGLLMRDFVQRVKACCEGAMTATWVDYVLVNLQEYERILVSRGYQPFTYRRLQNWVSKKTDTHPVPAKVKEPKLIFAASNFELESFLQRVKKTKR